MNLLGSITPPGVSFTRVRLVETTLRNAAARVAKRNGHTALAHSASRDRYVYDIVHTSYGLSDVSEKTKRGLWVVSTGLICLLTRMYKGLSRRLILMPTTRVPCRQRWLGWFLLRTTGRFAILPAARSQETTSRGLGIGTKAVVAR